MHLKLKITNIIFEEMCICNVRNVNNVPYFIETFASSRTQIWNLVPKNLKYSKSFNEFIKKYWKIDYNDISYDTSLQNVCTKPRLYIWWLHWNFTHLNFAICYLTITLKGNIISFRYIFIHICIYLSESIFSWFNINFLFCCCCCCCNWYKLAAWHYDMYCMTILIKSTIYFSLYRQNLYCCTFNVNVKLIIITTIIIIIIIIII